MLVSNSNNNLRDKRSSGVVGVTRKAEIVGIRLDSANMRLSNSQMYERKESSEEGHFTASYTVEKKSFHASEVIL